MMPGLQLLFRLDGNSESDNESQDAFTSSFLSVATLYCDPSIPTDESENGNWTKDLTVYYVDEII
jgi:hypothetical protein